ncbi:hypothetical protein H206_02235 [Candidatus Electrothrix aarhusensis]|uniref:Uncharacterized protein n=1 Tax=Candidatus Electrothrix aarhusensis TaxID=1859131 RepID=A0A444ITK6_9BACT|nr:hypothetical protein H206_02235 [Candidatus Electrothrix aarhusensis]
MEAVAPYLMGKIVLLNIGKAKLFEKSRLIRQGKNPAYLQAPSLIKAGMYQLPADSLALVLICDCQRSYLCQIFPADMEGADA